MTRKDYVIIANCINNTRRHCRQQQWAIDTDDAIDILEAHLMAELKNDNQAFNEDKFLEACKAW